MRDPIKIRMVKSLRFLLENNISLIIFQPIVKRQRTVWFKIYSMADSRYRRKKFRFPSLTKLSLGINWGKWLFGLVVKSLRFLLYNNISFIIFHPIVKRQRTVWFKIYSMADSRYRRKKFRFPSLTKLSLGNRNF